MAAAEAAASCFAVERENTAKTMRAQQQQVASLTVQLRRMRCERDEAQAARLEREQSLRSAAAAAEAKCAEAQIEAERSSAVASSVLDALDVARTNHRAESAYRRRQAGEQREQTAAMANRLTDARLHHSRALRTQAARLDRLRVEHSQGAREWAIDRAQHEAAIEDLRTRLDIVELERNALAQQVARQQSELEACDRRANVAEAEAERADRELKTVRAAQRAQAAEVLRDAEELANTRREQRTHVQSVEQELTALRLALREARGEASKATEDKVEALAKQRSAAEAVDNVQVEYEHMEAENKLLQSEIASQRQQGRRQEEEILDLRGLLKEMTEANASLQHALHSAMGNTGVARSKAGLAPPAKNETENVDA